jgi:UDP-MurNAc hydroxylase
VRITFIGHAGLFIETRHGSILTDPWFNSAYFASWFPFPSNEGIDRAKIANPDYLFVSHLHHDHFDPEFLRQHVSKETTVLLPDYPLDLLERGLREVGFTKFLRTKNGVPVTVDGLRLMISAAVAPTDGPLGDSGLSVDDGEVRIFNQNDSRPVDLDMLADFGDYDAHFLQFSGAIWYPMVYLYPEKMMDALGRKKRENQMARALRFVKEIGATHIIPSAGPPCFLDDDLYGFNDFDRDPKNIFPDQTVFLEFMRSQGHDHGHLMIPGSVGELTKEGYTVTHPMPDEQVQAIFTDKRSYLDSYQARKRDEITHIKASWPRGQVDILAELRDWFEPLMDKADLTAAGINSLVVLDCGETKLVLDFHTRKVYPWQGEEYDYFFRFDPALIESLIVRHVEDWINELFLSCRFQAERKGAYNEYVYNFFKCLSMERLQYAEGYYAEKAPVQTLWESNGYRIQRRCPHLKADLTRFAHIEDGVLTCTLHGWQFELETGRCLTSDDRHLYTQKIDASGAVAEARSDGAVTHAPLEQPTTGASIRDRCYDCWYDPKKFPASKRKKAAATEE